MNDPENMDPYGPQNHPLPRHSYGYEKQGVLYQVYRFDNDTGEKTVVIPNCEEGEALYLLTEIERVGCGNVRVTEGETE